jgi:hypothetical protein
MRVVIVIMVVIMLKPERAPTAAQAARGETADGTSFT